MTDRLTLADCYKYPEADVQFTTDDNTIQRGYVRAIQVHSDTELEIEFGKGFSREADLLDLAVNMNFIEKSGTWFSVNGERMGQGRESAKQFLKQHPETVKKLDEQIRAQVAVAPLPNADREE